jgi:hypothetical protein
MAAATRRQSVLKDFEGRADIEVIESAESSSWANEVEQFLEWNRAESSVGENWTRRMRWELNRVPYLLQKVGATPVTPTLRGKSLAKCMRLDECVRQPVPFKGSATEVARRLGVSRRTVFNRRLAHRRGLINSCRITPQVQ